MKQQLLAINKIKASKNGMDPDKMEKDLQAFFDQQLLDSRKAPSQSPRQQIPINPLFAECWKEFFLQNSSIVHLDFSNNDFSAPEIEIMAEGLKENHSIMGLHMIGNEATVDGMGFIQANRSNAKLDNSKAHVFSRIRPNLEMGHV